MNTLTSIRTRISPALVLAFAALALSLGGVAIAKTAKKNTVATKSIKNNAVKTSKIADGNVTTPDIADNAVTGAKIADGAVDQADLSAGAKTALGGSGPVIYKTETQTGVAVAAAATFAIACPAGQQAVSGGWSTSASFSTAGITANTNRPNTANNTPPADGASATGWRLAIANNSANPIDVTGFVGCATP